MKHGLGTSVGLLACVALAAGSRAAVNDSAEGNPYHAIVVRNVFDLHAPVVVQPKSTEAPKPPANVKLTGLATIFGKKEAYFSILEPPPPGKPAAKLKYCTMTVGERKEGMELLEIDLKGQKVKLLKDGEPSELALEKAKSTGAPPSAGVPLPMPMPGGGGIPRPGPVYNPAAAVVPNPYNPAAGNGLNNGAGASPLAGITRPVRTEQQMDPETQIVMMELERERTKEAVSSGTLPPIPFTPLTEQPESSAPNPGNGGGPPPVPGQSPYQAPYQAPYQSPNFQRPR